MSTAEYMGSGNKLCKLFSGIAFFTQLLYRNKKVLTSDARRRACFSRSLRRPSSTFLNSFLIITSESIYSVRQITETCIQQKQPTQLVHEEFPIFCLACSQQNRLYEVLYPLRSLGSGTASLPKMVTKRNDYKNTSYCCSICC